MISPPPLRWLSLSEQRLQRRRRLRAILAVTVAFLFATLFDRDIWNATRISGEDFANLRIKDWYQCLRQFGFLPLWAIVALFIALADFQTKRPRWAARGGLIILSAALSGLFAEAILGILMRQRPGADGLYWFSWLNEGLSRGPGHGFPSSHVAVAFGAAWMICRLWPLAGILALVLASGCALTRMLAGAHFASDAYGGALVGWLSAALLWRIHLRVSLSPSDPARPALPYACR